MEKKIYIGNLAQEATEEDLRHNFEQLGKVVSVQIVRDRYTSLSRGFGFVEMDTEEEAAEVIKSFNNGELYGKKLIVNEAKPRKESGGGRGFGGGRSGGGGRPGGGGGGGRRY
jgi:RNA recognition motif-containing protein